MGTPVCVITGGAGDGIGGGICRVWLRAGFLVVVSDLDVEGTRRRAKELEAAGYQAMRCRSIHRPRPGGRGLR